MPRVVEMLKRGGRALRSAMVHSFVVIAVAAGCAAPLAGRAESNHLSPMDPASVIRDIASSVRPDGPYRDPSAAERHLATTAVATLLSAPDQIDQYRAGFERLGFEVVQGNDSVTSRRYILLVSREAAWGALLIDATARLDLLLEVPHPGFDIQTETVGIEMFRARPGAVLLVAGAHRHAAGGLGDAAHNDKSMFHTLATALAAGGLAELQLHGFADANLPETDMVVSAGAATQRALAKRVGDYLKDSGFTVCLAWRERCGQLEGTTNVQGQAADEASTIFVHLEINWSARNDVVVRRELVAAVVAAT